MKTSPGILLSLALAAFGARAGAAASTPEQLLPKDTLLVISAPDWGKAKLFWSNQPYAKLWQDASMKPFKDKFLDKFNTGAIKPLEQSLGIKFSDYEGLAQGQVTFAVVPVAVKSKSDAPAATVLLIDTKDRAGQLKTNLAQVLKKWADAGRTMKSQKIREADFTTLFISPDDLSWKKLFPGDKPADPADAPAPATNKLEVTLGQSGSLLLVSSSPEAIDKILSRQAGGMVPPLEESPVFHADYGPRLRESPFYFWLNAKVLTDLVTKMAAGAGDDSVANSTNVNTFLSATGLGNLGSLSVSYKHYPEGDCAQFFLAVPEDKRPPLLKMFAAEAKDAAPPSFVPADATSYWRWRLNMARSYKTLEGILTDLIPPQAMAQINMVFAMAGKDKDEHYDLKSELLNNLGDDIISYGKAPKSSSMADIKSPPTLYLIGSPNPEKLAAALKVLLAIPFQGTPITDREFLGRKIYNIASPTAGGAKSAGVSFAASGGYLAIAGDTSVLEEYLRSGDSKAKSLTDMPGLADAAQKVGGMGTGLFGFANETQTIRPLYELLRKKSPSVQDLLSVPIPDPTIAEQLDSFRQWVDFSLLPSFDAIAKYFSFSVYAGTYSSDGFALKMYKPTPPQLR